MDADKESFQEVLQKNFYLFSRFIAAEDFLEKLISEDVLTIDDKEIITNSFIHHNRRERANKLIEILMTRGERGYEKFLEILEYQYPHVYQDVTKKEPREPPPGYPRNRMSDHLRMIRNLPSLLEQMKVQVIENSELDSQLCVLQKLLEVSKDENMALEREVEMLKNIRQENRDLVTKMKQLETDNYEHQVTINTWATKAYHLIEAQTEYKDKCSDLQVRYDSLYKEYTELKSHKSADSEQGTVGVLIKELHRPSPPRVDNGSHIRARLDILEQELENYKMQCEEMTTRLQKANGNVTALEDDNEKLNKELRKQMKEKKNLEKQLTATKINKDSYSETIKKKNNEIMDLLDRSRAEQQRLTELVRENKELFERNHCLDSELQSCRAEIDRIKARFSGSSLENTGSSQEPGSSGSEAEQGEVEEYPRVHRTIQDFDGLDLGLQCLSVYERRKVVKKGYSRGRYIDRLPMQRQGTDIIGDSASEMALKANTLPAKANESPEKMFQREVALFRFTCKREQPLLSDSMSVNTGSVYDRRNRVRTGSPVPWEEGIENIAAHNRAPTIDGADSSDDIADNASESTVYIPRTSAGRQQQQEPTAAEQIRKSSLPTGGKVVYKRKDNIERQPSGGKERVARCVSIRSRSDSLSDGNVTSDFSSHEVHTALLPKDCLVVNRPGWTDMNMSRRVIMKFSNLTDKSDFKGGNHTGIFLTKPLLELNEGEQIKGIIFTPYERVNPVVTDLKGCTLQDFYRLLGGDFINKKKLREICLEVRNSKDEYKSACEWMYSNKGHGDYFYIRCNVNLEKKREDNISLKSGDIFLVKNSCHGEEQWQGYMIDAVTGEMSSTPSLIPNMQLANLHRLAFVRSCSGEDEESMKRGGRRVKGQAYDRVLPMKASTKLPVYILGPCSQVVSAVLDLISSNLSNTFIVDRQTADGDAAGDELELYRHDMHIVRGGRLENIRSRQSVHRVTVFINITAQMSPVQTKKLFGKDDLEFKDTTITQCEHIKQRLVDAGHYFEEISIPSLNTKDGFIKSFKGCVATLQNRILWLSNSEMDEQVANKYPTYLGQLCDLSKIHADLHQSQNS